MTRHAIRLSLFVLLTAVGGLLTGCKSESSPTAPPTTTTPGTSTTPTTPPSGATVTLSFANNNPVAPADDVVTATVTLNGAPVPNGTAVQFVTNIGTFKETAATTALRTTTNGVATVTLTSTSAGSGTVTATVNNVQKSANITFSTQQVTPPPPSTNPTITGITPNTGVPQGGTIITITGTNFRTPVRVIVDPGNGQPTKDAFVNQVTPTQIIAVMPAFDVATGSTLPVSITVVDEAGTANQQSVTQATAFTYASSILTPSIRTLDPTSGPIDGGTRIAILGDAFQAPVQVFFGSAEAQVIRVTFNEIDVVSPAARDTSPNGSAIVTGPVDVRVVNINSNKSATSPQQFRYVAKAVITAINPVSGPSTGGTNVTIDGTGFNAPVTVDIAGVRATVLSVSPTEIIARTNPLPSPCANATGVVVVTNVDNGDTATSVNPNQAFTYLGVLPFISSIVPPANNPPAPPHAGQSITVNVANPGTGPLGSALVSFTIDNVAVTVAPQQISSGSGTTAFNVIVPDLPLSAFPNNVACGTNNLGLQHGPAQFELKFTNATTSCSATANVTIAPDPNNNPCVVPPPPTASVTAPSSGCANAGSVTAAGTGTGTATITIANTGGQPLTLGPGSITGTNASDFTVAPTTATTVPPGSSASYTITFDPSAVGTRNATITFTTNDPINPNVAVCLTGTGT